MRNLDDIVNEEIRRNQGNPGIPHGRPPEIDLISRDDDYAKQDSPLLDNERDWHPFAVQLSQSGMSVERGQVLVPKGGVNKFEWVVPTIGGTEIKDSRNNVTFPTIANGTKVVWLEFAGTLETGGFEVTTVIIDSGASLPEDTETEKYIAIADVVYASIANHTVEQYVKSDFSVNWASGVDNAAIHWKLTCDEEAETVSVGTGRINNLLLTVSPFALTTDPATQTIYIKTTWTPFTNDTGSPYGLDGADMTAQEILAIAGTAVPATVCPLIDESAGTPTDGEYYIPIGTQGWQDAVCVTDNDNLTKSIQITFCPPCDWHYWPVAG
jgi:hypothetical protein